MKPAVKLHLLPTFSLSLGLLAQALFAPTPAASADQVVAMHGYCFRSPFSLSAPATAGTDAVLVAQPP